MKTNRKRDDFSKIMDMYQEVMVPCCKCGRKEVIPYWRDKQLCSWCGHYIYRNKKMEFRDKLKKEIKIKKYESERI